MNKTQKFLAKQSRKEKDRVLKALEAIELGNILGLDVKKLKGDNNLFRIRIGRIRIIYSSKESSGYEVMFVGLRSDTTYKN